MDTSWTRMVALLVACVGAVMWFLFANIGIVFGLDNDLHLLTIKVFIYWSLFGVVFPTSRLAEPLAEIARRICD